MSKKDYQAIAGAIYSASHGVSAGQWEGVVVVRNAIMDVFAADNPRFSRERFIEACETGKTKGMKAVTLG